MKTHLQSNLDLKPLADRIRLLRVAMLTLPVPHQGLQSRPMTPLEIDAQGCIWMVASKASLEKVSFSRHGVPTANLSFSSEADSTYVSITGRLESVDDDARKADVWSLSDRRGFKGPDDPDLVVLSLSPQYVEVWEGPHSVVVQSLALTNPGATVRASGLKEHRGHRKHSSNESVGISGIGP